MKKFSMRFQGSAFGRMYPIAWTFQPEYHEYLMDKMYVVNKKGEPWLKANHKLKCIKRDEAEVIDVTASYKIIKHVVNIKYNICTYREWQVSRNYVHML